MEVDKVPERHREAIQELATLDHTRAKRFVEALKKADPALLLSDVAAAVAKETGLEEASVRRFLMMLGGMSRAIAAAGVSSQQFVASLGQSVAPGRPPAERAQVTKLLLAALGSRAVQVSSKALSVMTDNERMFCRARVLSDLRPVFADDDLEPSAAVVVHSLRISFHEHSDSESTSDVFIALDVDQLRDLRRVVDRAIAKHEKIESLATLSKLPVLKRGEQ